MAANQVTVSTPGPAGVAGLTYEGLWSTGSVYQVRDLVRFTDGNLYTVDIQHTASSGNTPTADASYWTLFINADDAFQWATKLKHSLIGDSLGNTGYSALHQASKAQDWATKINGEVTSDTDTSLTPDGFSAKAYAIGGTGVDNVEGSSKDWATEVNSTPSSTSTDASAKEWAIGTSTHKSEGSAKAWAQDADAVDGIGGNNRSAKAWSQGASMTGSTLGGSSKDWSSLLVTAIDGTLFSSKEYAQGVTASTGGSAKDWATYTTADVRGAGTGDMSAKEWAVGVLGRLQANEGSAKDWATRTTATVDNADWSAKEFAIGTTASTGGSSKDYATYVGGGVRGATSDHSSKAWAVGGVGVTTTADKGAAKQWATTVNGKVDGASGDYSAKEYAIGSLLAVGGSAKNWAQIATTPSATATDASAKEWAAGVSTHKSEGSAKEWAIYTAGDVRGASSGSMSSKEWAVGVQGRGVSGEGSSKDWAIRVENSIVDDAGYSSLHHAAKSAASAVAAAASETSANASVDAVSAIYDAFSDKYLGEMLATATQGTNPQPTGTWAKNSSTITVSAGTNIKAGQVVTGSGIPSPSDTPASPKPNVLSITGTTVILSDNMDAAGSGVTLTFTGHGIYGTYSGSTLGPTTNNDGDALSDGVKYFDSTNDVMMVYDETTSKWKNIQPTVAQQANIDKISTGVDGTTATSGSPGLANLALINTAATSLTSINSFASKYRIASSAPGSDNDDGDLYYNTATNQLNVHDGSAWGAIGQTEAQSIVTADNSAVAMAIALG